jgi:hypothetical protein
MHPEPLVSPIKLEVYICQHDRFSSCEHTSKRDWANTVPCGMVCDGRSTKIRLTGSIPCPQPHLEDDNLRECPSAPTKHAHCPPPRATINADE